jgi:hypothetical protein
MNRHAFITLLGGAAAAFADGISGSAAKRWLAETT